MPQLSQAIWLGSGWYSAGHHENQTWQAVSNTREMEGKPKEAGTYTEIALCSSGPGGHSGPGEGGQRESCVLEEARQPRHCVQVLH